MGATRRPDNFSNDGSASCSRETLAGVVKVDATREDARVQSMVWIAPRSVATAKSQGALIPLLNPVTVMMSRSTFRSCLFF